MMAERVALIALYLTVGSGALVLIMWAMDLYDRMVARSDRYYRPEQIDHVPFEDWRARYGHLYDAEGEALPPGGAA